MSNVQDFVAVIAGNANEVDESYVASDSPRSMPVIRNVVVAPDTHSLPIANDVRLDGFDEVFDPPITQDYECPICMNCLRDPVQTACGHRFCKSCIDRHLRLNARRCPADNQALDVHEVYPDNFAKREISQFPVKCRTVKEKKSCPWKGELQKLEDHLVVCEFVEVPCPNACGQNVERKLLETHTKKDCSKRKVICQHCKTDLLHKNFKDHIERCQKLQINCPNCKQKMLREKLQAHLQGCPKAQVNCEFVGQGCKWTGARSSLGVHLNTDITHHVSLLGAAVSRLETGNQSDQGEAAGPSCTSQAVGAESSQQNLKLTEDLNRKVDKNGYVLNQLKIQTDQMERRSREEFATLSRRSEQYNVANAEMKKQMSELEARMCNGVFLWRVIEYSKHVEDAHRGLVTAVHSSPFYTSFYGYKLCLRINPNGVDTGYGTHVSLFVHMMQSDWDDTLEWPFSGRISLSILDQSDDGEHKRHISETLVTRPNLLAFQRPTTPRNHKGYGYVEFAHLETLQDRQYIKNDCLLIRVQVFL